MGSLFFFEVFVLVKVIATIFAILNATGSVAFNLQIQDRDILLAILYYMYYNIFD